MFGSTLPAYFWIKKIEWTTEFIIVWTWNYDYNTHWPFCRYLITVKELVIRILEIILRFYTYVIPSFKIGGIRSSQSPNQLHAVSWWEVMVSWHLCTFISWEKPRELPHFVFLLLSLMLHDSKLMLKLYYLRVPTSLLTGCDTKVALDSGLSLGAWKQKLTTLNRKKQSVKGRNLLIEISLTKVFKCGLLISGR